MSRTHYWAKTPDGKTHYHDLLLDGWRERHARNYLGVSARQFKRMVRWHKVKVDPGYKAKKGGPR